MSAADDPPEAPSAAVDEATGDAYARRLVRSVVGLAAVVVAVVVLLASLPGLDQITTEVTSASAGWLWIAVGLEYLSSVGYVLTILLVFEAGSVRTRVRLAWSELAANSIMPAGGLGGLGLGAWVLSSHGMPSVRIARRSTVVFLLTSVPTIGFLVLVGAALGLGLLDGPRDVLLTVAPAVVGVLIIVGSVLATRLAPRLAARTERARLSGAISSLADGARDTAAVLRLRDWRLIGPAAYFVLDVLVLWAAFQAIGVVPPLAVVFMAHLLGQLAGSLPIPGGLGVVDGGLVGALVLYGVDLAPATAAVLLYRVISLGLPALLGTAAFLVLRRSLSRAGGEALSASIAEVVEADPRSLAAPRSLAGS